jgi:hypothetical protein
MWLVVRAPVAAALEVAARLRISAGFSTLSQAKKFC